MNMPKNHLGVGKKQVGFALNAFTLAEVLITLVVIGVIAAITVPMLMTSYKKQETVSRLKKVYSSFAQTTSRAVLDNGPVESWDLTKGPEFFLDTYIAPYLDIEKNCEDSNLGDCEFKYKLISGKEVYVSSGYWRKFFLRDGTRIAAHVENSPTQEFSFILVDINGLAKPNRMGRDVFAFIYFVNLASVNNYKGKFMPIYPNWKRDWLKDDTQVGCNRTNEYPTTANFACAALIMNDGWEIKDDYPW